MACLILARLRHIVLALGFLSIASCYERRVSPTADNASQPSFLRPSRQTAKQSEKEDAATSGLAHAAKKVVEAAQLQVDDAEEERPDYEWIEELLIDVKSGLDSIGNIKKKGERVKKLISDMKKAVDDASVTQKAEEVHKMVGFLQQELQKEIEEGHGREVQELLEELKDEVDAEANASPDHGAYSSLPIVKTLLLNLNEKLDAVLNPRNWNAEGPKGTEQGEMAKAQLRCNNFKLVWKVEVEKDEFILDLERRGKRDPNITEYKDLTMFLCRRAQYNANPMVAPTCGYELLADCGQTHDVGKAIGNSGFCVFQPLALSGSHGEADEGTHESVLQRAQTPPTCPVQLMPDSKVKQWDQEKCPNVAALMNRVEGLNGCRNAMTIKLSGNPDSMAYYRRRDSEPGSDSASEPDAEESDKKSPRELEGLELKEYREQKKNHLKHEKARYRDQTDQEINRIQDHCKVPNTEIQVTQLPQQDERCA